MIFISWKKITPCLLYNFAFMGFKLYYVSISDSCLVVVVVAVVWGINKFE